MGVMVGGVDVSGGMGVMVGGVDVSGGVEDGGDGRSAIRAAAFTLRLPRTTSRAAASIVRSNDEFYKHNRSLRSSLYIPGCCCTADPSLLHRLNSYGRMAPITKLGRMVTMVYAAIGIPLMLLLLADLGDILAVFLSRAYNCIVDVWHRCFRHKLNQSKSFSSLNRRSERSSAGSTLDSRVSIKEPLNLTDILKSQAPVKDNYLQLRNLNIFELMILKQTQRILPKKGPYMRCYSCPELEIKQTPQPASLNFDKLGEELDQLDVPILVIIFVVVAFIMLGAFIFPLWEKWSTLEAFYFCFITLTTIGFGDVFPEHPNFFLLLSVYTVMGMAIICMAFKLMQNRMVSFYKNCITCVSGGEVYRLCGDQKS
ncbi:potassium channel subfamily K member 18 [Rhinoderma darwinii]|uniref:potassium channel subfamily K member 18 n=1 Tax=Rhinoderma darwinii TaxID=43563 RepID=UPI003F67B412